MATRDSVGRIAKRLLELAADHGSPSAGGTRIELSLSQDELARWTGATRETVSRALRLMRQLGWVATNHRTITVLDPAALRDRAGARARRVGSPRGEVGGRRAAAGDISAVRPGSELGRSRGSRRAGDRVAQAADAERAERPQPQRRRGEHRVALRLVALADRSRRSSRRHSERPDLRARRAADCALPVRITKNVPIDRALAHELGARRDLDVDHRTGERPCVERSNRSEHVGRPAGGVHGTGCSRRIPNPPGARRARASIGRL